MRKRVLITGVSRGIGKGIFESLKDEYDVFVTSRSEDVLSKIAGAVGFCAADLSARDDLFKLKDFIDKNDIDILINNAGIYEYVEIGRESYENQQQIINVNLLASMFLTSAVAPKMKGKHWGRIINIGSISGVMGESNASSYSASKAGLIGFTKALALELASDEITVNVINPGWVDTELGMDSIEKSEFSQDEILECIPQRRFVTPQEIGELVKFLISDNAKSITGQSINVCAGLSLGF